MEVALSCSKYPPDPLSSPPLYSLNIELSLIVASLYRLVQFGKAAYQNTRAHLRDAHTRFSLGTLRTSLLDRNLFRRIAFPTRLPGALAAIDSSLDSLCRHEIETNLLRLRTLRESQAAGLGLLVSEGMDFSRGRDWKEGVVRGIDMMKLRSTPVIDISAVSTNLLNLAQNILPNQNTHTSTLAGMYGRPSALTRYWPLGITLLFSGSTILRIFINKRQQLSIWLKDSYLTLIDFWRNWVVSPVNDIISTIRHEDSSQIALMGRQSLQSDMESLERMVVEFAKDNAQYLPPAVPNTTDALEVIRKGVREGDLSPVLRAYESDLRTPLRSAVTGT